MTGRWCSNGSQEPCSRPLPAMRVGESHASRAPGQSGSRRVRMIGGRPGQGRRVRSVSRSTTRTLGDASQACNSLFVPCQSLREYWDGQCPGVQPPRERARRRLSRAALAHTRVQPLLATPEPGAPQQTTSDITMHIGSVRRARVAGASARASRFGTHPPPAALRRVRAKRGRSRRERFWRFRGAPTQLTLLCSSAFPGYKCSDDLVLSLSLEAIWLFGRCLISSSIDTMTLAERARRAAIARPPDTMQRAVVTGIALATAGTGISLGELVMVVVGGFLLGYQFRPEAERYYMEGFSYGLAAAETITADGPDPADRGRAGLRALRGGPPGAVDPAADGARGDPGGAARGGAEPDSLAAALGIELESRPTRHPFDVDGAPFPTAEGPRRSTFPVPAATTRQGPVDIRASRAANGRRTRQKRA